MSKLEKKTLSNSIRTLRFMSGEMTQQQLADKVGVTRQTIVAIEQNKYAPSLEVAFRIADVFAKGLEDVFQYPRAVSYTHLDVYKRQIIPAIIDALYTNGQAGYANIPLFLASLIMTLWPENNDEQVSNYTFQEKSDFIILVSIIIVYGCASFMIVQNFNSGNGLYWIILSSIVFAIITLLSHVLLAISHKPCLLYTSRCV